MRLLELEYSENTENPQKWALSGLSLGARNLIVGKNATGKTRTTNVIVCLSRCLSGLQNLPINGNWEARFINDSKIYRYTLSIKNEEVALEQLYIDDNIYLDRGEGGIGRIFTENLPIPALTPFQAPPKDLAALTRRDTIQHSYLEPLFTWASSLRYYPFGTPLGKDLYGIIVPNSPKADDRDSNAVIGIYREAISDFPEFPKRVIEDFSQVGYDISEIGLGSPISLKVQGLPAEPVSFYVKEKDLPGITDQHSMSSGMFRSLSLIIQINFFQLKNIPASIVIDDIGEGLDFDRSCRLIELLRKKSVESDLQLIMTTNDKFVMNEIPLDEWSVLVRKNNVVTVHNQKNSPEIFDEFRFTGLSNFSLLELDFLNQAVH